MNRILLASHGPLAKAMKETAEFVLGRKDNIYTLCAYVDDDSMDLEHLADTWIDRMGDGAPWIVLTDVFGGSVNHAFMNRLSKKKFYLLAGMNVPLVAELASYTDTPDEDTIKRIIGDAQASIRYCNHLREEEQEDDDF